MNTELKEAVELLEKEKGISRESLLDSIEQSLMTACRYFYGKNDNIIVNIDPDTLDYTVTAEKEVVQDEDHIVDPTLQVTLEEARRTNPHVQDGDIITIDINSKSFGRIAIQNAKNIILQRIREEERNAVFNQYSSRIHTVVSGVVSRYDMRTRTYFINLGRADGLLNENEQVRGEHFRPTDRVKVYVVDVRNSSRGPKILVSRTHPDLVRKLFEEEVAEVHDGTVEIRGISREPGSRTKMAVWSNDPDVDPVGACVGMNGSRVNAVVDELRGEKIDIVEWDENPAVLIEHALSPAKVITVGADPDARAAKVIVPDYQLSLAIGKEGQNARLAARLTGYKIDIKSETQARESGDFDDLYLDDFDENGEYYEEDENVALVPDGTETGDDAETGEGSPAPDLTENDIENPVPDDDLDETAAGSAPDAASGNEEA